MDITGKKISILGAGKSGLSAAKLASFLGADIFISDSSYKVECEDYKNFENELGQHSERVLGSNLSIKSPGIPTSIEIIIAMIQVIGFSRSMNPNINFFLSFILLAEAVRKQIIIQR